MSGFYEAKDQQPPAWKTTRGTHLFHGTRLTEEPEASGQKRGKDSGHDLLCARIGERLEWDGNERRRIELHDQHRRERQPYCRQLFLSGDA